MNDYWLKRAEAAYARSNKSVSKALPELISNMQDARRALEKEINAFYARYASNNKITLAEAQKALSFSELADFKGDLKSFRRLAKNSIGRFDLEVDNLSVQARITRLQALETQCDAILQRCYQAQRELMENSAAELAQEQYLHSLYDIEQYTGFRFPYSQLSTSKIKKMVEMPVNGADISTSLWRQDIDTGFQIRRVLNNMFTTGRPPQDFAKELQKIIGQRDSNGNLTGKTYEAYRLLYNESAHISEQASMQAYADDGIDQYEITATFDKDACKHCQELDGKVYDCKDAAQGVNMPPFHVNCRCTTVPYIPEAQGSYTPTRAARDPETGKTIRVKKQSFEEWKKSRVAKGSGGSVQRGEHYAEYVGKVDIKDSKAVYSKIEEFEHKHVNDDIESCLVITESGDAFIVHGDGNTVNTTEVLGDKMKGSISTHNHPAEATQYSFSDDADMPSFIEEKAKVMRAFDDRYVYQVSRGDKMPTLDEYYQVRFEVKQQLMCIMQEAGVTFEDYAFEHQHFFIKEICERLGIAYERRKWY